MNFKIDKGTGYMYCHNPEHYCANSAGKVMEHVHVMAEILGRPLMKGECVHHIDRDRTNNSLENLRLMTRSDHARLHQMEDKGVTYKRVECASCKTL